MQHNKGAPSVFLRENLLGERAILRCVYDDSIMIRQRGKRLPRLTEDRDAFDTCIKQPIFDVCRDKWLIFDDQYLYSVQESHNVRPMFSGDTCGFSMPYAFN